MNQYVIIHLMLLKEARSIKTVEHRKYWIEQAAIWRQQYASICLEAKREQEFIDSRWLRYF